LQTKLIFLPNQVLERSTEVHRALEEILLFFLVMSIPVSYLAGIISSKFCLSGVEDQEDMELNKVQMVI
jgi:hypothetical protein